MQKILTVVLVGTIFCSCGGLVKKDVREFIEGSYTRHFESDFAVGIDSVVLRAEGEDHYLITKYSRFTRFKNGERGKEELLEEKMAGIYDAGKQVINELKKGKVLHFNPDKNTLLIGPSEYQKIK